MKLYRKIYSIAAYDPDVWFGDDGNLYKLENIEKFPCTTSSNAIATSKKDFYNWMDKIIAFGCKKVIVITTTTIFGFVFRSGCEYTR